MKNDNTFKTKFTGKIVSSFYDKEAGKLTLSIGLSADLGEKILNRLVDRGFDWKGDSVPVKEDDKGNIYLKSSTNYTPEVQGIDAQDLPYIGVGSEVELYVQFKQGTYMRKPYVACYLIGVRVYNFVEREDTSVFDDESFENFDDTPSEDASK